MPINFTPPQLVLPKQNKNGSDGKSKPSATDLKDSERAHIAVRHDSTPKIVKESQEDRPRQTEDSRPGPFNRLQPKIVVCGVGGGGGNAVNNMIAAGVDGVEYMVANTDAQALALSRASNRVQLGEKITMGLGAGMDHEKGREAAEDSLAEIIPYIEDANMLFIAAGMGGGTGTGAASVIARAARERDILTVAIVTKPFKFEGRQRMSLAETGIEKLYEEVDTLITLPNENVFRQTSELTTLADAFSAVDELLTFAIRSVTDLIFMPGIVNLDFADVSATLKNMGGAIMGIGEVTRESSGAEESSEDDCNALIHAFECAVSNPLIENHDLLGAKKILVNITGSRDEIILSEIDQAMNMIWDKIDMDAVASFGTAFDEDMKGRVRVSIVASGGGGTPPSESAEPALSREKSAFGQVQHTPPVASLAPYASVKGPEMSDKSIPAKAPVIQQTPDTLPPDFEPSVAVPVYDPSKKVQSVKSTPKRGWGGLFGRPKQIQSDTLQKQPAIHDPYVSSTDSQQQNQPPLEDLFGSDSGDDIAIPSFFTESRS